MNWDLFSALLTNIALYSVATIFFLLVSGAFFFRSMHKSESAKASRSTTVLFILSALHLFCFLFILITGSDRMRDQIQHEVSTFLANSENTSLVIGNESYTLPETIESRLKDHYVMNELSGRARIDNSIKAYTYNMGRNFERTKSLKSKVPKIYKTESESQESSENQKPFTIHLVDYFQDSLHLILVPWAHEEHRYAVYYPKYSFSRKFKISDLYSPELAEILNPN